MFTQVEHARLSGELAKHIRGTQDGTAHRDSLILACTEHDAGWPIHDDAPRITPQKKPVDVFELPSFLGFLIWSESSKRVTAKDAYAGLLVSLHSLGISVFASRNIGKSHPELAKDASWQFELNKFQHREIERQEKLRRHLGMRTDLPLEGGLARESDDPQEQELFYNFRIVQTTDQLSLCMCCNKPPFQTVGLIAFPGERCVDRRVIRTEEFVLEVDPWPLDIDELTVPLAFRRVPMIDYTDDDHFRREYGGARLETIEVMVRAKG